MAITKQRTLDYLEQEWGTYVDRFNQLPVDVGMQRVRKHGYERFRDMLAHILSWWDEVMPIISAIAEGREYPRKKYDFDAFNAAAVEQYHDWDESEFMAHFEKRRQEIVSGLRSVAEPVWDDRRVKMWANGVFIHHAREHLVTVSRFLTLDVLENEWSEYIERFEKVDNKDEFLKKNGVGSLRELLGHVIAWWEVGAEIISNVIKEPGASYEEPDTDSFNAALIEKYSALSDESVRNEYEQKRRDMIQLVKSLPQDAFSNSVIEEWLAADVIEHFDDHVING